MKKQTELNLHGSGEGNEKGGKRLTEPTGETPAGATGTVAIPGTCKQRMNDYAIEYTTTGTDTAEPAAVLRVGGTMRPGDGAAATIAGERGVSRAYHGRITGGIDLPGGQGADGGAAEVDQPG